MPSAATIRLQVEAKLARRIPSALTPVPRVIRLVAPTGVREVDELLEGGLPVGAITEIIGPESSGRTGVALSFVNQLTHAGKVCAWVDVSDALCPESAAAAGIDLAHLLWVRCGASKAATKPSIDYKFSLPEKYMVTNRIHHGDCIEIMQQMPANSVDFILTDPPYLVNYRDRTGRSIQNDVDESWLNPSMAQAYRVLKQDRVAVMFYGWTKIDAFFECMAQRRISACRTHCLQEELQLEEQISSLSA
jgi:hypothetical protein